MTQPGLGSRNTGASILVATLFCGVVGAGCGTRAVGSAGDAGGQDPDGEALPDGGPLDGGAPDAGQAELWGTVTFADESGVTAGSWASAQLSAAFFATNYAPSEAVPPDFVETRVTHDNVECDIYFSSPNWGWPPPVPPEPDQVDVGEVRLESAFDSDESFALTWLGSAYSVDSRPSSTAPIPGWVVPGELEALVVFLGSTRLPAGNHRVSYTSTPTLLEPIGDDVVRPDADGLFRIAWEAEAGVPVRLRLDMNMDWDNATFVCRPPTDHSYVLLPQTWLNEYSWGSAELRVTSRLEERFLLGDLDLRLRARRTAYRSVQFEIVW